MRVKKGFDTALALGLTAVIFLLVYLSADAKAGASEGIRLCEGVIIPSLLPVLIIANILLKSRAVRFFESLLGGAVSRVLRLPKSAATPILFGLIAGYPSGAVLTLGQYRAGKIDEAASQRIMRFNFCGGVAFIITAVGRGYYGSARTGAVLYGINILSSIIIAACSSFLYKGGDKIGGRSEALPFSDALCLSAETASKSVILMSAYIILFCALKSIINPPAFLAPILEITSGIFASGGKIPLPFCAAFLSFGGLCIHLQLAGMLGEMKVKFLDFFVFRTLSSVLSFALCKAYLLAFPDSAAAFNNAAEGITLQFTEANAALGVIAMLGCAMLVLEIENRKIRL